jgi:hypothetical protein
VDTLGKEHEYYPLPEFSELLTRPIELLNHNHDGAFDESRIKPPGRVRKFILSKSRNENKETKAIKIIKEQIMELNSSTGTEGNESQ